MHSEFYEQLHPITTTVVTPSIATIQVKSSHCFSNQENGFYLTSIIRMKNKHVSNRSNNIYLREEVQLNTSL